MLGHSSCLTLPSANGRRQPLVQGRASFYALPSFLWTQATPGCTATVEGAVNVPGSFGMEKSGFQAESPACSQCLFSSIKVPLQLWQFRALLVNDSANTSAWQCKRGSISSSELLLLSSGQGELWLPQRFRHITPFLTSFHTSSWCLLLTGHPRPLGKLVIAIDYFVCILYFLIILHQVWHSFSLGNCSLFALFSWWAPLLPYAVVVWLKWDP